MATKSTQSRVKRRKTGKKKAPLERIEAHPSDESTRHFPLGQLVLDRSNARRTCPADYTVEWRTRAPRGGSCSAGGFGERVRRGRIFAALRG